MRCAIIIPAYLEEKRIKPTLEAYGKFFTEKSKVWLDMNFQILISINGPKDNTQKLVEDAMKKYPIINYIYTPENGKGLAIKKGFEYFLNKNDSDYIGFVDADMSTEPAEFMRLTIRSMIDNKNVTANRYDKESVLTPPPGFKRRLASRTFNKIVRFMFFSISMRDTQCGCKIFLANDLKKIVPLLETTQWAFDVELLFLLKKHKCTVCEVPTKWENRDYSKINLGSSSIKMVLSLIRLRIVNSPFKWLMKIYNRIPEKYKFHHYI